MKSETAPTATDVGSCYQVDDLLIDSRLRRVTRAGAELGVSGLSFDLLLELVRNAPRLITFDALMESVWSGVVVGPETVTQRVSLLRQALGDSAENPRYIFAVRGHGYRMAAATVPLTTPKSPPHAADSAVAAPLVKPPRGWLVPVAAVLVISVAVLAWWTFGRTPGARPVPDRAGVAAHSAGSIAVMPFANMTGDPGKTYFGDGMAEELIDALANVPGLKVPARTSTFAYKGRTADIRQIGNDLGVATVLEGSVRSAGERIRISARLVDAGSGYQIWSQTYDRQFGDIFKLQDALAAEIVQALRNYVKVDLPPPAPRPPPSQDLQAYQLYLEARSIMHGTEESQHLGLALLDEAVARDPNFARALASRAFADVAMVALGYLPPSALDAAQRDAERALVLSPGLADGLFALGWVAEGRHDWSQAEVNFHRALAVDGTDSNIRGVYGSILRFSGRLRRARLVLEESLRLSPVDGLALHELALTSSVMGLDTDAIQFAERLKNLTHGAPPNLDIVRVYVRASARAGRFDDAAARAPDSLPLVLRDTAGAAVLRAYYTALADPRLRPVALRALQGFLPRLRAEGVDSRTKMYFVTAFTTLGAIDAAYALAARLAEPGGEDLGIADWSDVWLPEMRPFRQDPRFAGLMEHLKLIDFWRRDGPPDECDLSGGTLMCH
ncbi:MAG: winged helix-turn-helix domain-containing protein [Steroidobacteraceae bacterium]